MKPTLDSDLIYMDSILGDDYVDSISKPIDFLGFEVGARMATHLMGLSLADNKFIENLGNTI